MIRSNSFALFTGRAAPTRLSDAVERVGRYSERVLVSTGGSFAELGGEFGPSETAMAALAVGATDGSLPLVHGFVRHEKVSLHGGVPTGEFAMLDRQGDDLLVARDILGTRPLFFSDGAVASDHRFLVPSSAVLLPPGRVYSVSRGLRLVSEAPALPCVSSPVSAPDAQERLCNSLLASVSDSISGCERVAVSFSGGLDSALLALLASRFTSVVLCSVHTRGSRDEQVAGRAAELLNLEFISVEMTQEDVAVELGALDLPFDPTPMDRALWCIYRRAGKLARKSGAQVMLLGQLADELFGGYFRYAAELGRNGEAAAEKMMRDDVLDCSKRAFIRDEAACGTWIEPRFPFANEEVVRLGLGLPVGQKISDGTRKVILREAGRRLGLPEELTCAPKKAAQYSSGVMKQVGRLSIGR